MQIALLGGTGDIGEGLALRLARDTDHTVWIGSRDPEKASRSLEEYERRLPAGVGDQLEAGGNEAAAAGADVVVLSVPAYYLADTIESVAGELEDTILVSPAVGMKRTDGGFRYNPPGVGSVTKLAAQNAPGNVPVVGAFHNLPATRLADLDAELGLDVPLVADDTDAKATVSALVEEIDGLRPLDAGSLEHASEVEALTPLLVTLAHHNDGLHDLGVTFH